MAATIGNNCVKQITLIRKDLETSVSAGQWTAAQRGEASASLSKLAENLDRYEGLTKTEANAQKHDRQVIRLRDLRAQYGDLREVFERRKRQVDAEGLVQSRQELLGRRAHHNATPENPYAHTLQAGATTTTTTGGGGGGGEESVSRRDGNLKEASALSRVGNTLDEYIESGLASLGDLRDQNSALKGTQRRLRDVAVGLGISGDTIRTIERRIRGDKWVFYGGCIVTLFCFFLILRYLG